MKRSLAVTLLWLACSPSPSESTRPAASGQPSAPRPAPRAEPASKPAPAERNIFIDAVKIANPVVVTGRARTFESHVTLRARDENGVLITETFTTATGEMGRHSPFEGTIWLTRDPGPAVTVEALEYSARDGSEQSLVAVRKPFAVELVDVRLFLPNEDCTAVVAHQRRVPKSISMARLLVEMLLAEPAPFPKDSRLQSINLREGTLTVDFNARLQNVGGACAARMIRESVTRTLLTLPAVKRVVLTAGGSESLALQP